MSHRKEGTLGFSSGGLHPLKMIADNLNSVRQRIARCCEKIGRSPDSVALVCVVKEADPDAIQAVLGLGISDLGENRVQEALRKFSLIGDKAYWHLVGHLQTNKVKDALKVFSLIHSVDSVHLAEAIDGQAARIGKVQDILIQVNTSGEASKFGLPPAGVFDLLKAVASCANIKVRGLMTIAPEVDDPELVRPYFRALCELRDKINALQPGTCSLQHLSMGMTNDFEVAIEEGSTMVRIGRAIFGEKA